MKQLINFVIAGLMSLLFTGQSLSQQRVVERSFEVGTGERINLDLKFGEAITVKAWDKNEVSFRAVIEINDGKLNDALILDFDQKKRGLTVSADYDKRLIKQVRREDCPDRRYSTYSWNDDGDHYAVCSNIVYEIFVPLNTDLEVESISSDIELIGLQGPIRAKSISGFVDLSWPSRQGAELLMKTISGEVFSGLDNLTLNNRKRGAPLVGYELRGIIAGGGPRVSLESISGNIYVRKDS